MTLGMPLAIDMQEDWHDNGGLSKRCSLRWPRHGYRIDAPKRLRGHGETVVKRSETRNEPLWGPNPKACHPQYKPCTLKGQTVEHIATNTLINLGNGRKVEVTTSTAYLDTCSAMAGGLRMNREGEREGDDDKVTIGHAVHENNRHEARSEAISLARKAADMTLTAAERAAYIKLALRGTRVNTAGRRDAKRTR